MSRACGCRCTCAGPSSPFTFCVFRTRIATCCCSLYIILITLNLKQALISYQDYHMLLLTLARRPGVAVGTRSLLPTTHLDITVTVLELAGATNGPCSQTPFRVSFCAAHS